MEHSRGEAAFPRVPGQDKTTNRWSVALFIYLCTYLFHLQPVTYRQEGKHFVFSFAGGGEGWWLRGSCRPKNMKRCTVIRTRAHLIARLNSIPSRLSLEVKCHLITCAADGPAAWAHLIRPFRGCWGTVEKCLHLVSLKQPPVARYSTPGCKSDRQI